MVPPLMSIASSFIFATCNASSEGALKAEIAREHGSLLTPAFMRPRLVTWKASQPLTPAFELKSVFAQVSGLSLGLCKNTTEVAERAAVLAATPFHLHVFPRETTQDDQPTASWSQADTCRDEIAAHLLASGLALLPFGTPADGDAILDVIVEPESRLCLLGIHRHRIGRHPLPGACPRVGLLPSAPSRAWLKMEQALALAGLDARASLANQTVLELGCAPGGASWSLLQHGARVVGMDTAAMDPRVLAFNAHGELRFTHIQASAGDLARIPSQLHADLLVSDMNLAPPVVLKYLEAVQKRIRARAMIITLKLNDRTMEARLPHFIDRLAAFAPSPVHAAQLPANRREVCLFTLLTRPRPH